MTRTPEEIERRADFWARWTAVLVLGVGSIVVVLPAVLHVDEVWDNPFVPSTTTTTEVTTNADGTTVEKTTVSEPERSFVERSLAAGGLFLLRLAAVALAAFIAGAVVQRAILGRFDLKLGPLELPETKRAVAASEQALAAIQGELARNVESTAGAMTVAADAAEGLAALAEELDDLRETMAMLIGILETPSSSREEREDDLEEPT